MINKAFTMAEILLSLTIIGVVAAITLPSLTGNINERTWNTQRKALYARFSQALALMPSLKGYEYSDPSSGSDSGSSSARTLKDSEVFVTEGLAKVLKINNICDANHLEDCGIPEKFTMLDGTSTKEFPSDIVGFAPFSVPSDLADEREQVPAAFETANGESILVYYFPQCTDFELAASNGLDLSSHRNVLMATCVNFVYDLNGNKGPNTVGKDIGVLSAMYPTDPIVVAPMPTKKLSGSYTQADANRACRTDNSESRAPNLEEAISLSYNYSLFFNGSNRIEFWSTGKNSASKGYTMGYGGGYIHIVSKDTTASVVCIKR